MAWRVFRRPSRHRSNTSDTSARERTRPTCSVIVRSRQAIRGEAELALPLMFWRIGYLDVSARIEAGPSRLGVVANGIASESVRVVAVR